MVRADLLVVTPSAAWPRSGDRCHVPLLRRDSWLHQQVGFERFRGCAVKLPGDRLRWRNRYLLCGVDDLLWGMGIRGLGEGKRLIGGIIRQKKTKNPFDTSGGFSLNKSWLIQLPRGEVTATKPVYEKNCGISRRGCTRRSLCSRLKCSSKRREVVERFRGVAWFL